MVYNENTLGVFPILQDKVNHLITWGPFSTNMSPVYGLHVHQAHELTAEVMHRSKMVRPSRAMWIVPQLPAREQIREVTSIDFLNQKPESFELETGSNFLYTTDKTVALMVRPGDCTVSVMYAKLPSGKPMLGVLHAGRAEADLELGRKAVDHWHNLGIEPSEITIGITPSISFDNYYILEKDQKMLQNLPIWENHGKISKRDGKIYLDILGFLLDQYTEAGILGVNMQVYKIDTLTAAMEGNGFSQRLASYTNDPNKNGRYLVVAQIP